MDALPHHYRVTATLPAEGDVPIDSDGLPTLTTAPPKEFGGPGDRWSPETLFAAAVADCFLLTFRAVARASKLAWTTLDCECVGTVDKRDGATRFTEVVVKAHLKVPAETPHDRAEKVLVKSKAACLVTNSLSSETRLETFVETD